MKTTLNLLNVFILAFFTLGVNAQTTKLDATSLPARMEVRQDHDKVEYQVQTNHNGKSDPKKADAIITLKKEYFKKNLQLTNEEASQFWPLFEKYLEEEKMIHQQCKSNQESKSIKRENGKINFEGMSSEQVVFYYENRLTTKQTLAEAEKRFFDRIKIVLGPQAIVQYYQLEKNFKNEVSRLMKPEKKVNHQEK